MMVLLQLAKETKTLFIYGVCDIVNVLYEPNNASLIEVNYMNMV